MEKQISLKPDFKLLNPEFNGYKLSSDADVTVYTQTVECQDGLERRQKNSSFYLHTRLEALHNHLFGDPFNALFFYHFSSKGHLLKYSYSKDTKFRSGEVVWQADLPEAIDEASEESKWENLHYFASVQFPSPDLAVVSNGQGSLHVLETEDRANTHSWLECFECSTQRGKLIQAKLVDQGTQERHIHCLITCVVPLQTILSNEDYVITDEKLKNSTSSSVNLINWITLKYNGATWELNRTRTIVGEGTIEYCSVDETATGILLLCHKDYSFIFDSLAPVVKPSVPEDTKSSPKFSFLQTAEDITVWLNIGTTKKNELKVDITVQSLTVTIQDTEVLSAKFLNPIHNDSATWTISDGKLEIVLPKAQEGLKWSELFQPGYPVGEELLDPQLVEEVNRRLAHLTSDRFDANPDPDNLVYNPCQTEACDQANEDLILLRLDGTKHNLTGMCHLGATQHLFNGQGAGNMVPSFCIRHDVDGILWQPEGEDRFTHMSTYNAFGFVKASKTMAKLTLAASDNSYVAVADVNSHIYVFFQPEAFGGELRNRKSGKRMNTVARQVVISLKTHSEILGLYTTPDVLFVLTEKDIFAYCLRSM